MKRNPEFRKTAPSTKSVVGQELRKMFAARPTTKFGEDFTARNRSSFRFFYCTYQGRLPQIWQTPSAKLPSIKIAQKPAGQLVAGKIGQTVSDQLVSVKNWLTATESTDPFILLHS